MFFVSSYSSRDSFAALALNLVSTQLIAFRHLLARDAFQSASLEGQSIMTSRSNAIDLNQAGSVHSGQQTRNRMAIRYSPANRSPVNITRRFGPALCLLSAFVLWTPALAQVPDMRGNQSLR
jgi:hypothetical protein